MNFKEISSYTQKMSLKEQLQELLESNGLSLSQLSKESGIPVQTLHNWVSGVEPRSLSQVKKIADFFSVSIDYLCFGSKNTLESSIKDFSDEINAGVFEVVLRRIKK